MSNYTKEDIFRMVEEEDVEFIRLQFTDIFGTLKNVAITSSQLEKAVSVDHPALKLSVKPDIFSPVTFLLDLLHIPYPFPDPGGTLSRNSLLKFLKRHRRNLRADINTI